MCRSYTVYCSISFRSILFCVVRYRGMFLIQTQCSVLLADIRMVFVCIFFEFLFFHLCVLFIRLFLFSCILLMDRIATFVAWLFVYFLVITRTPISFWFSFFGYCQFMIYINCLALICVCVRQIERQAIRYSCSFLFNFNCFFFFFLFFFFLLSFIHFMYILLILKSQFHRRQIFFNRLNFHHKIRHFLFLSQKRYFFQLKLFRFFHLDKNHENSMMLEHLNDTLCVIWRWRRSVGKKKSIIQSTHNLYITFSVNSMLLLNVLAIHAHTKTKDMDAFIPHVYSTQFHLTVWFLLPDVRIQNLYQRQWRICRFGVFVAFFRLFAKYLQMASNVISISLFLLSSANHMPICKC